MAKLRFIGDLPSVLKLRTPGEPITDIPVEPSEQIEIPDDAYLAHEWASSLWDEVDVPKRPADDGPFDPTDHTVDEVAAYLADADEGEAARVLRLEAAGKNRKSITGEESSS